MKPPEGFIPSARREGGQAILPKEAVDLPTLRADWRVRAEHGFGEPEFCHGNAARVLRAHALEAPVPGIDLDL